MKKQWNVDTEYFGEKAKGGCTVILQKRISLLVVPIVCVCVCAHARACVRACVCVCVCVCVARARSRTQQSLHCSH
jgi:hypothetical protein